MKLKHTLIGLALASATGVATAGPSWDFGEEGFLEINYALQAWSEYRSYRSVNHDGAGNDMYLRRNRITLMGQQSDLIGFYAQLDTGSDSKNGQDEKAVYYRDAYITIDYSDEARFILGRFKATFSRENLEACLEPLTLDRGDASYTPFRGSRDTGVAIWGNLADAKFQYRLMLADGREGDVTPKKTPRVTARAHWTLLDPEFDYGYRGTYLGTRRILTFGAGFDFQGNVAYADVANQTGNKDYKAWTVDGFFEYPFKTGTYTLSAAYLDYDVGNTINEDPNADVPANTQLQSYYVKGGYMLPGAVGPGRLQFFTRYDHNDYNLDSGILDHKSKAVGANYYIDGQKLKLTAEFQQVDYDNEDKGNPALENHKQFTAGFQFIL